MALTEQSNGDGQASPEKKPDLISLWRQQKPLDYKFLTSQIMPARFVIALLCGLLLFLGLWQLVNWRGLSSLEKIEQAASLKNKEQIIIDALCIILVCYRVLFDCVKTAYAKIACGRWLKAQNENLTEYMNAYVKSLKNSNGISTVDKKAVRQFIECAYRAENPSANTAVIGYAVVLSVLYAISMAFGGIFFMDIIDEFIKASIVSEKLKLPYTWLIICFVVSVVMLAVQLIGVKLYNEKFRAWTDRNIVEKDWLYDKYPKMFKTM